jgi:hypothetical protein
MVNKKKINMLEKIIKNAKNIGWYPSAGFDIATAYFFNTFSENEEADLFIFTDPWYRSHSIDEINHCLSYNSVFQDFRSRFLDLLANNLGIENITCNMIRMVDNFNFGLEITRDGNQEGILSPVYLAHILVNQNTETEKKINVLLVGCYNESFCNNFLFKEKIEVKYLAFKNASGYGGYMSGLWIFNTIRRLNTKFIATEIKSIPWNEADDHVVHIYPELGPQVDPPTFSEEEFSVIISLNQEIKFFRTCSVKNIHNTNVFPNEFDRTTNSAYFGINQVPDNI